MKKKITERFLSWSASRLDDYTLCPHMAMHKHLLKTCPACFKGRLQGGYDKPAICDKCRHERVPAPAMARGGEIGESLEKYVNGTAKKLHEEIENPGAIGLATSLRKVFKKKQAKVEFMLNFDREWNLLPEGWSPRIWLIVKMDVMWWLTPSTAEVIDWKTGGIDKRTGAVRAQEKYDDQLALYQVAALSAFPALKEVRAMLCFVDAGENHNPMVVRDTIARPDVAKERARLTKLALPMMTDDTFAPRPSDRCRWCDYSKGKGGPCPF